MSWGCAANGQHFPVFRPAHGDPATEHLRDCGECIGCAGMSAEDFSVRCHMEALGHMESCVLTLTLDDEKFAQPDCAQEFVPLLQSFFKRVRHSGRFRYVAVAERGMKRDRLHAHVLVFGRDFREDSYGSFEKDGKDYYYSRLVDRCWYRDFGDAVVMPASPTAIFYAAGDALKNFGRDSHLLWSKKPLLGFDFMARYADDFNRNGFITIDGTKHRLPPVYKRRVEFYDALADLRDAAVEWQVANPGVDIEARMKSAHSRRLNLEATLARRRGQ